MHRQHNRHGGRNLQKQIPQLSANEVAFTENGELDKNLFNTKAEHIANILAEANLKRETNSYTQIRRFYDEVNDFFDEIEKSSDKEIAYKTREPLIFMLNSKVSYARGREKVDDNFVNFIKYSLDQVKNAESFKTFKLLFEAVMGFLRAKKSK